jgi:hypothetical protein
MNLEESSTVPEGCLIINDLPNVLSLRVRFELQQLSVRQAKLRKAAGEAHQHLPANVDWTNF